MQTIEITTDEQLEEFIESATEATYFATEQSTSLAFVVFCSEDGDWYATRPPHEEDPKDTEGHWLSGVTLAVDSLALPITVIDPRNCAADTEREVKARALREAALEMDNTDDPDAIHVSNGDIDLWLEARADRIERGEEA